MDAGEGAEKSTGMARSKHLPLPLEQSSAMETDACMGMSDTGSSAAAHLTWYVALQGALQCSASLANPAEMSNAAHLQQDGRHVAHQRLVVLRLQCQGGSWRALPDTLERRRQSAQPAAPHLPLQLHSIRPSPVTSNIA